MLPASIRQEQLVRPRISRYVRPYAAGVIVPGVIVRGVVVRRHAPCAVLSLGAVITIVGSLCPWVASGRVDRSSYEIIDLVDSLGFAEEGPFGLAVRAWPLMPLVVVSGTVAMWWRRHIVGPTLALIGGLYAFGVALAVRLAPSTSLLRIRVGTIVTIVGASVLVAGTLAALALAALAGEDQFVGVNPPDSGTRVGSPPAEGSRRS
jgi:hypothetical protein